MFLEKPQTALGNTSDVVSWSELTCECTCHLSLDEHIKEASISASAPVPHPCMSVSCTGLDAQLPPFADSGYTDSLPADLRVSHQRVLTSWET